TGTSERTIYSGIHALVLVFGLHAGSIGFVGRDALQNVLGELTLVIFSARTLPISQEVLLGVFVIKDVIYYSMLFLLPLSFGAALAIQAILNPLSMATTLNQAILTWMTLVLMFLLGVGLTVAFIGASNRGIPSWALVLALSGAVGVAWINGINPWNYTPFGLFLNQTPTQVMISAGGVVIVFLSGAIAYESTIDRSTRQVSSKFRTRWQRIKDPLATKTLIDVHRSSGGFGKVLFSGLILFGVTSGLIDLADNGRVSIDRGFIWCHSRTIGLHDLQLADPSG
ncbi:MAG: hypothetical protein ABEI52_05730, partial [Halobacteriaceae archaeon]